MKNKKRRRFKDIHLRTKLSLVIAGTMFLILLVNTILYVILNRMTQQLDDIYVGNVKLNELEDALDKVESSMAGYLNTKGTDTLDEYYRAEQAYQNLMDGLEKRITDNQLKIVQDIMTATMEQTRQKADGYLNQMQGYLDTVNANRAELGKVLNTPDESGQEQPQQDAQPKASQQMDQSSTTDTKYEPEENK